MCAPLVVVVDGWGSSEKLQDFPKTKQPSIYRKRKKPKRENKRGREEKKKKINKNKKRSEKK